jgi:hypothetical protein
MKQEYIIGDVVMYENRIHTIIDILASNGYELSYVRHPVSPVRLSGVPLTSEILEKNGWEKVSDYNYIHPKHKFSIVSREWETHKWSIVIGGFGFGKYIGCVSDLQHFLFGIGLNHEMEV